MSDSIPAEILDDLELAHPSWRPALRAGLAALARSHPGYLPALVSDTYLPTEGRLFAAFAQPLDKVRYVLIGEGPYPRAASATGVCFMDGAVKSLWSEKGLSKEVNRATSLRNFMKMLLVCDGQLSLGQTSGDALAHIATAANTPASPLIQTLAELQDNLTRRGFLLLNASLVFRPQMPPQKEARAWEPFLQTVLATLAERADERKMPPPTLVLWGKIAELLSEIPANALFPKVIAEHPYNLSFIANKTMHTLFAPMHLLRRKEA